VEYTAEFPVTSYLGKSRFLAVPIQSYIQSFKVTQIREIIGRRKIISFDPRSFEFYQGRDSLNKNMGIEYASDPYTFDAPRRMIYTS
jgi:hypothetical protein